MTKRVSRRDFLKSGLAAATVAASGAALPRLAMAATDDELCTVLDVGKCIGCEACVEACREAWQSSVPDPVSPIPQPFPARVPIEDWSKRKDVQDRLTPYNFLYVEMLAVSHKGQEVEINIPRRCMHCRNAPCANLCPFGAARVEGNGVVHIDGDLCLGGAKCKNVCPWKTPQRQSGVGLYLHLLPEYAGNGAMFKCHRCLPLVRQGQTPRCIEVCPEKVQTIGPRQEMVAAAAEMARAYAQADGRAADLWPEYVYGLEENGGTNTIYVAPVPFAAINQAMIAQHKEQAREDIDAALSAGGGRGLGPGRGDGAGPELARFGRPSMGPQPDAMQSAKNLTWALAIAPVAGLAAGLGKFLSSTKDKGLGEAGGKK